MPVPIVTGVITLRLQDIPLDAYGRFLAELSVIVAASGLDSIELSEHHTGVWATETTSGLPPQIYFEAPTELEGYRFKRKVMTALTGRQKGRRNGQGSIATVQELLESTPGRLMRLPGFGVLSLIEVQSKLAEYGQQLRCPSADERVDALGFSTALSIRIRKLGFSRVKDITGSTERDLLSTELNHEELVTILRNLHCVGLQLKG